MRVTFHFSPFTTDESLKDPLPLMTVVNELWSNHSGSAKHRRRPNDTLRHNTLIKAHLESESASPVSLRAALIR